MKRIADVLISFILFFILWYVLLLLCMVLLNVIGVGFSWMFDEALAIMARLNRLSRASFYMLFPSLFMGLVHACMAWKETGKNFRYRRKYKFKDIEDDTWDVDYAGDSDVEGDALNEPQRNRRGIYNQKD